jgi:hypothetical protein
LSHFLMNLYGSMPGDAGAEAVVAFVREKLGEFLIPLGGDEPGETVQVALAETAEKSPRRVLNIALKPILKIHGKDVDFALQLALPEQP